MRHRLEHLRWHVQRLSAWRPQRVAAVPLILGLGALSGWGVVLGKAATQRNLAEQVASLRADRDALTGRVRQMEQANGELLRDMDGKLTVLREELRQASTARDAAKAQLAASQRDLVASRKRVEQMGRDRVTETGSIKPNDSAKKPASKP